MGKLSENTEQISFKHDAFCVAGGLDEVVESIKSRAKMENIPIIFALGRRDLAYCVFRKVPVSCMAVLNYGGAEVRYL